jgi:CopG family transcriptional regulator / antitoxin EndoAI
MRKRINMILPDTTVALLDRVASKGVRSRFIDRAVRHYVETQGMENLRERLKAGYQANAERDLAIAAEWFPLEEEAWRNSKPPASRRNPQRPNGHDVSPPGRDLPCWSSIPHAAVRSKRRGRPERPRSRSGFGLGAGLPVQFISDP